MKLWIDTNILLDVLAKREPHLEASSLIWKFCEIGMTDGYVSALSLANLVYVMRRSLDPDKLAAVYAMLSFVFRVEDVRAIDLRKAAELRWTDFEDALQYVGAERIGADFIITRNQADFMNSSIRAITPEEFLRMREQEKNENGGEGT